MNNYWLIPMDFRSCNYAQLKKEWDMHKKIMWQVPVGTPKYKKGKWIIDTPMALSLKKGDIIYFYVTNLSSESKKRLSRIMLRGIIEDEPYPTEANKVYMNSNDTSMIIGFSIGFVTTLCKEQLEDNLLFTSDYLTKLDSNFKGPQGTRWPDKNIKQTLSSNIINNLEPCFKNHLNKNDFNILIDHFNRKCFFCDKYGERNEHKTFIGRNGLDYFEYHHLIPKNEAKKLPELSDIINSPSNGLFLCSTCHNKFHYGTVNDVNEMLKTALDDITIQKMLEDFNFQKIIGEESNIFEWFQKAYNLK